jgi:LysR family transcriptional activator of nhaA
LLKRVGRGLEITDLGRRVAIYAEEIFGLEDELVGIVKTHDRRTASNYRVGVADSVPKSLTYSVLAPALQLSDPVRLVCREGPLISLLADLAVHRLDMVIADRPVPPDLKVRAFNHLLGSSELAVFGAPALLRRLKGRFPAVLDKAPFLLPGRAVAIRPLLEQWFDEQGVRPQMVGEFDDSALLKAFGQAGTGLFVAPAVITDYVCRQYGVKVLGRIDTVIDHFYAISTERRLRHPATLAISEAASRDVFGLGASAPKLRGRRS